MQQSPWGFPQQSSVWGQPQQQQPAFGQQPQQQPQQPAVGQPQQLPWGQPQQLPWGQPQQPGMPQLGQAQQQPGMPQQPYNPQMVAQALRNPMDEMRRQRERWNQAEISPEQRTRTAILRHRPGIDPNIQLRDGVMY